MTKKQIAAVIETLVEQLAEAHGATVIDAPMIVGGRETTVRKAQGGLLDLDACRRILGQRLQAATGQLTAKLA